MDLEKIKLIIRELIILKDSTRNAVNKIMQDEKYAVDYRRELADKAKQKAAVSKNNLCDQAIGAIEAMKKEWLSGKSSMQKDQTFELQFSNTMKVIEAIGEEMTKEELTELVRPFHEDYFVMKILRNLCIKKGIEPHKCELKQQ